MRLFRIGFFSVLIGMMTVAAGAGETPAYLALLPAPERIIGDVADKSDVKRAARQLGALTAMMEFLEALEQDPAQGGTLPPEAREMHDRYRRAHDDLYEECRARFIPGSELWKAFYRLYLTYDKRPDYMMEVVPRYVGDASAMLKARIQRDHEYFQHSVASSTTKRRWSIVDRYKVALGSVCFALFIGGGLWGGRRVLQRARRFGGHADTGIAAAIASRLMDAAIAVSSASFLVLGMYFILE